MKKYEKPYLQSNEISLDDIILLSGQNGKINNIEIDVDETFEGI